MFKGLPLAIAFIALPTLAAPQNALEIDPGDVWVAAGFVQSDFEVDYNNSNISSSEVSSEAFAVSSLIALEELNGLTPLLGFNFENEEDDSDSATVFTGKVGFLKTLASQKKMSIEFEYNHSDNAEETRSSYGVDLAFQTSHFLSDQYNEIEISLNFPKKEGNKKGGSFLSIADTFKVSPNELIDIELLALMSVNSKTEYTNQDLGAKPDLVFGIGGDIYFNFDPQYSLSLGARKIFYDATLSNSSGAEEKFEADQTGILVALIGRF